MGKTDKGYVYMRKAPCGCRALSLTMVMSKETGVDRHRKKDYVMVKHIILWQLKDEYTEEQKAAIKQDIKAGLEGLVGKVPGLLEVTVNIDPLETSNADLMLDSTLESFEALKGYAVHPDHVAVADGKVRPNVKIRVCIDYEV